MVGWGGAAVIVEAKAGDSIASPRAAVSGGTGRTHLSPPETNTNQH